MSPRLQAYVTEAATLRHRGCNPTTCPSSAPVITSALGGSAPSARPWPSGGASCLGLGLGLGLALTLTLILTKSPAR